LLGLHAEFTQFREEHWVIADLQGKAGHIRTVPAPAWVKEGIDAWKQVTSITEDTLFQSNNKAGRVWASGMTPEMLWEVVREAATRAGIARGALQETQSSRQTMDSGACHRSADDRNTAPAANRPRRHRYQMTVPGDTRPTNPGVFGVWIMPHQRAANMLVVAAHVRRFGMIRHFGIVPDCATSAVASWTRSSSCLATFPSRPPSAILGANRVSRRRQ